MALYLIGDVQGCDSALQRLLNTIHFSPSQDTLYLLGDLVNRGPASAAVLRRLMGYGASAQSVLGNHDLHLLAIAHGSRKAHRKDTLDNILEAPDRAAMLHWLRHQNMAILLKRADRPLLLVHAGLLPTWTVEQTLALAHEVESMLRGEHLDAFFANMYGNTPSQWSNALVGMDRLRTIVNGLTRLRFCSARGEMEFDSKEGAQAAPSGFVPWFDAPNRQTASAIVAFGHWSTLGRVNRPDIISLDTGCVWGGCLSAVRFNLHDTEQELVQVKCEAAQQPGIEFNPP